MKQVIIVRKDLKMPAGKLGVQTAHAESALFTQWLKNCPPNVHEWLSSGSKKVLLRVHSETELIDCYDRALKEHLYASIIKDNANTFFNVPTFTCICVGPYADTNPIFDHLDLY